MKKALKDIGWLLSGGIGETILQRNLLKEQLAATQTQLHSTQAELKATLWRETEMKKALQSTSPGKLIPMIMLVTLPKSGSIFLVSLLQQGLNTEIKKISSGYVPVDLIEFDKLRDASAGQAVCQSHLDANPTNLRLLKEYCPRVVLNLRDPRQALLSWVHHVIKYAKKNQLDITMATPAPPPTLFQSGLSSIIDWHLAHHFPGLLNWMDGWLAHLESGNSPSVLISQFEDLRANPEKTIDRILDFYDIPKWTYISVNIPKNEDTHYRKGQLDEWREVFNPAQQKICADMIANYPRIQRMYPEEKKPASEAPRSMGTVTFAQNGQTRSA